MGWDRRILLVDADLIAYRLALGREVELSDEIQFLDLDKAKASVAFFIGELREQLMADDLLLCFSGRKSFRYSLLSSYKHNRKDKPKPELFQPLREWMLNTWNSHVENKLEGDDLLGLFATESSELYVSCSIDKDLRQIPGWFFNWNKSVEPEFITPEEADHNFWLQTLTGDPTDGYSGCPNIGIKRATKILDAVKEPTPANIWKAIVETYAKKNLTSDYAVTQARMARILRHGEYNWETKQVRYWMPPQEGVDGEI